MSVSRWSLGMFLISTLLFFGVTGVQADEEMATTPFDDVDLSYSSLSVTDTRLDMVEGNPDLVLSAKLRNIGTDTRTFGASVEFRRAESESNDASRVLSPESYTLSAGEQRAISFSVFRPLSLSGSYIPTLVVGDEKGTILAMMSFAPVELTATEQVEVKNCSFGPSDGDNGVLVTALDAKESEIIIACEATLTKGKPAHIRMVARAVDGRTAEPMILGEKTLALSTVALPVRLFVPTKVAGSYQLEVVMMNENNQDISAPVRVPLTVKGNGGKILGLTELKKDTTQPMALPVGVAVELYDDAEYALSLALLSDGVACAEPVSVAVQNTNLKDAMIQVTKNCPNPVLSATLLSGGSTVLDKAERGVSPITGIASPMMETSFFDGILSKLPWIIVAILGVFAGYFIFQKERLRRMAPIWVLALASVFFGFSVDRVQAAATGFTLYCNDISCPSDATVFYNFWTDKNTYAPGETINITMSIASDDHPVPSNNLCPEVRMRINGGSNGPDLVTGCYSANQFTAGIELNLTQTAPMSAGAFTIGVTVGQNGYASPPSLTMSGLSVAGTATASFTSTPSCTIAVNGTGCNTTIGWTSANLTTAVLTNCSDTQITSTGVGSQSFYPVYVPYNSGCYRIHDGTRTGTILVTGNVSSSCVGGTTWDPVNVVCAPAASPTASFTSTPSCTIALNGTGCNTTIGWTSANLTTAVLTNCSDTQITSTGVGNQSFSPVYVPYNSGCYRIHDGTRTGPILATGNVNSSCASGTTWNTNSLTCVSSGPAPVNGTCGSAHRSTVSGAPSPAQQCSAGAVGNQDAYLSGDTFDSNGFISTGPSNSFYLGYYWECNGSGGGSSKGCFAYREPLCGSADGGSYSNAPTDDSSPMKQTLCQAGTPSSVTTNPTTYTWSCTNGTGPTDTCSATRTTGPTAQITARVVVASSDESWWQKLISFVTGRDHTAQATGPNANITTNGTAAIDWTSSGTSSCNITKQGTPGTFASGLTGSQSLSGATLGVGTHTFNISCSGPSGNTAPDSVNVIVTAAGGGAPSGPPGDGGGFFNANPAACGTGTINLSWNTVSGATSYQLRDGSTQIYSGASTSYSHTGLVAGSTHSYTVRAINSSGNSSWSSPRSATVASACAGGGFTVNLTASPASIASGSSTLTWTTSGNPTWCWATGGTEGTWNNTWQSVSGGSRTVTPTSTTTYTLECGDASTSVSDTATVTVGSGFTCTGSMSNHATVHSGDSTGLSANTPYSYSASNTGPKCQYYCNTGYTWDGSQCAGPTVSLTASPSTIASGDSSTLTWTPSSGVTSCWATGGTDVTWNNTWQSATGGNKSVSPAVTTTYRIECWNGTGTSTGIRSATVTVSGGGPGPSVNLTASPTSILVGGSSTLTWSTSGSATSCWASNGTAPWTNTWVSASGGSMVITPAQTWVYMIECWNAGGQSSGQRSVTVTVNGVVPPPPTGPGLNFAPSPASITLGQSSTLTWSTSNGATSCWASAGDGTEWTDTWVAPAGGSQSVSPTGAVTQYDLECWNATGQSSGKKSITVQVNGSGSSFTLTATPPNINAGNQSRISWTTLGWVISCTASDGWSGVKSGLGGWEPVSPVVTTTYTLECFGNTGSIGKKSVTVTVSVGVPARVNVCPASATLGVGTTQQFRAYHTPAGTAFAGCGTPNGTNVTSSANWTHAAPGVATVNNTSSKGLVTGVSAGNADFNVSYTGLSDTFSVVVSCTPSNSCGSVSSTNKAAGICAGDTFNINDGCGGTLTCSGTRVCDYNWKEVAP